VAEAVGFVGLGDMGGPMAANLARAGYQVAGFDLDRDRAARAAAAGVGRVGSVAEAAQASERVLISMVRTLPQTEAVLLGPGGAAEAARPGLHLLIMSTVDPGSMARLAEQLEARGFRVVDAPVSGGVSGAEAGTLSVMLAGAPAALELVRPLLEVMGANLFVFGERPGTAQAAKLANQMMLAVAMLGTFEGLSLAGGYGVDEGRLMEMLKVSTGGSWVVENWPAVKEFWKSNPGGGSLDIIYKDLRSSLADAAERRLQLPVTAVAMQRLHQVWKEGRA
jgi:3-hydroxyisobutyrate dehydrogenase